MADRFRILKKKVQRLMGLCFRPFLTGDVSPDSFLMAWGLSAPKPPILGHRPRRGGISASHDVGEILAFPHTPYCVFFIVLGRVPRQAR